MAVMLNRLLVLVDANTRPAETKLLAFSRQLNYITRRGEGLSKAVALVGTAAVLGGLAKAIKIGSDYNETINKTTRSFGIHAQTVIKGSNEMARKFGIIKGVFIDQATNIGLIGKAAGLTNKEAAEMGTHFAKLAADASSFYNVPVENALQAIRSGLVGQVRPLRTYGVLLSQAAVEQEAVRLGLIKAGEQLTDSQKVMARASIITKGLAVANNDLAITHDFLANRLREFRGRVTNAAQALGTYLYPSVVKTINAMFEGAQKVGPAFDGIGKGIQGVGRAVLPVFQDIGATVSNLASGVQTFTKTLLPPLQGLAGLSFTAVLGTLRTLTTILKAVSEILVAHPGIVQAIAIAYGLKLVNSLQLAIRSFLELQRIRIFMWFTDGSEAVSGFARSMTLARIGTLAFNTAISAAVLYMGYLIAKAHEGSQAGHEFVDSFAEKNKPALNSIESYATAIARVQDLANRYGNKPFDPFKGLTPGGQKSLQRQIAVFNDATEEAASLRIGMHNIARTESLVRQETGLTNDQIVKLANGFGVDMSKDVATATRALVGYANQGAQRAGAATAKLAIEQGKQIATSKAQFDAMDALKAVIGDVPSIMERASGMSANAIKRLTSAIADVQKAVRKSFGEAFDIIEHLGGETDITADKIKGFYKDSIDLGTKFVSNISDAVQRGLDPQFISRLLQEGPEKAAPLLQAIVGDHSNRLIGLVNTSEESLRKITSQAVEMSRLMQVALNSSTDQASKDITTAMRIAQVQFALTGQISQDEFAKKVGVSFDEAKRIADEFGIKLDKVQAKADTLGKTEMKPNINLTGDDVAKKKLDDLITKFRNAPDIIRRAWTSIYVQAVTGNIPKVATSGAGGLTEIYGNVTGQSTAKPSVKAKGGVDAHITGAPTVLYGERATGGEAFVPRKGIPKSRAMEILNTAAGWYGAKVVTALKGRIIKDDHLIEDRRRGHLKSLPGFRLPKGSVNRLGEPLRSDPFSGQLYVFHRNTRTGKSSWVKAGIMGFPVVDDFPYINFRRMDKDQIHRRMAKGGVINVPLPIPLDVKTGLNLGPLTAGPEGVGTGAVGTGWKALVAYLTGKGVPYRITSTTGGHHVQGSYHYKGKAVDLVGPNMMAIFKAFLPVASNLAELFYTPAGYSIKNGRSIRPPLAAADHYSHVHVASFDKGGYLQPGYTMAFNGTGRPEPVGIDYEKLAEAIRKSMPAGVVMHNTFEDKADPLLIADELSWQVAHA